MTAPKPDPKLWALVIALHDYCKSQDIELAIAAQPIGSRSLIIARVGEDEAVNDLLDKIRKSLAIKDSDRVRH